jgi:hypothetical protein
MTFFTASAWWCSAAVVEEKSAADRAEGEKGKTMTRDQFTVQSLHTAETSAAGSAARNGPRLQGPGYDKIVISTIFQRHIGLPQKGPGRTS